MNSYSVWCCWGGKKRQPEGVWWMIFNIEAQRGRLHWATPKFINILPTDKLFINSTQNARITPLQPHKKAIYMTEWMRFSVITQSTGQREHNGDRAAAVLTHLYTEIQTVRLNPTDNICFLLKTCFISAILRQKVLIYQRWRRLYKPADAKIQFVKSNKKKHCLNEAPTPWQVCLTGALHIAVMKAGTIWASHSDFSEPRASGFNHPRPADKKKILFIRKSISAVFINRKASQPTISTQKYLQTSVFLYSLFPFCLLCLSCTDLHCERHRGHLGLVHHKTWWLPAEQKSTKWIMRREILSLQRILFQLHMTLYFFYELCFIFQPIKVKINLCCTGCSGFIPDLHNIHFFTQKIQLSEQFSWFYDFIKVFYKIVFCAVWCFTTMDVSLVVLSAI